MIAAFAKRKAIQVLNNTEILCTCAKDDYLLPHLCYHNNLSPDETHQGVSY